MTCRCCAGPTTPIAGTDVGWCTACDVGWSSRPYDASVYDAAYAARYAAMAETEIGRALVAARLALLNRVVPLPFRILDYGCGTGELSKIDRGIIGFEPSQAFQPQALPKWEPSERYWHIHAVAFFDSLEHLPDPIGTLRALRAPVVVVTMPVLSGDLWTAGSAPDLARFTAWKHYRPTEHLFYASTLGLRNVMQTLGYQRVRADGLYDLRMEERLGREDVVTAVFRLTAPR